MSEKLVDDFLSYWETKKMSKFLIKALSQRKPLDELTEKEIENALEKVQEEILNLSLEPEYVQKAAGLEDSLNKLIKLKRWEFIMHVRPIRKFLLDWVWQLELNQVLERAYSRDGQNKSDHIQNAYLRIHSTNLKTFTERIWERLAELYARSALRSDESQAFTKQAKDLIDSLTEFDSTGKELLLNIEDTSEINRSLETVLYTEIPLSNVDDLETRKGFYQTIELMETCFGTRARLQARLIKARITGMTMSSIATRIDYDNWPQELREIIPREGAFKSAELSKIHKGELNKKEKCYLAGGSHIFYSLFDGSLLGVPQYERNVVYEHDLNKNKFDLPSFSEVVNNLKGRSVTLPPDFEKKTAIAVYRSTWVAINSRIRTKYEEKGIVVNYNNTNNPPTGQAGGGTPSGHLQSTETKRSGQSHPRISLVWQFVKGELSGAVCETVGIHIYTCADCLRLCDTLEAQLELVTSSERLEDLKVKAIELGKYVSDTLSFRQLELARQAPSQNNTECHRQIKLNADKPYLTIFLENNEGEVYLFNSNYYCQKTSKEAELISIEVTAGWKYHCYLTNSFITLPEDLRLEDYSHSDQSIRERIVAWFSQQLEENVTEWEQVKAIVSEPITN